MEANCTKPCANRWWRAGHAATIVAWIALFVFLPGGGSALAQSSTRDDEATSEFDEFDFPDPAEDGFRDPAEEQFRDPAKECDVCDPTSADFDAWESLVDQDASTLTAAYR